MYYARLIENDGEWNNEEHIERNGSIECGEKAQQWIMQILLSTTGNWNITSVSNEGGNEIAGTHENGREFIIHLY